MSAGNGIAHPADCNRALSGSAKPYVAIIAPRDEPSQSRRRSRQHRTNDRRSFDADKTRDKTAILARLVTRLGGTPESSKCVATSDHARSKASGRDITFAAEATGGCLEASVASMARTNQKSTGRIGILPVVHSQNQCDSTSLTRWPRGSCRRRRVHAASRGCLASVGRSSPSVPVGRLPRWVRTPRVRPQAG